MNSIRQNLIPDSVSIKSGTVCQVKFIDSIEHSLRSFQSHMLCIHHEQITLQNSAKAIVSKVNYRLIQNKNKSPQEY
jgi:hypothetical protein